MTMLWLCIKLSEDNNERITGSDKIQFTGNRCEQVGDKLMKTENRGLIKD